MGCREVKTGKDDIILMGGDVRGDWRIEFLHSMACYVLTMNNCVKVREGSYEGSEWMFPQFQAIKDNSVAFSINIMLQVWVEKVGGFKISDALGMSIYHGYTDDMVLKPTLDVLSDITRGGWNL